MRTTPLILCTLLLSALQGGFAASPSSQAEAEKALRLLQQLYASAQVSYGEVLAAERAVVSCRAEAGVVPAAELLTQLDSLWLRQEEYLADCLAGGVMDRFSANEARIALLSIRLFLERRAGMPHAETHERLRSLYEGNLALYERLFKSGLVPVAQVETARRALADFLDAT